MGYVTGGVAEIPLGLSARVLSKPVLPALLSTGAPHHHVMLSQQLWSPPAKI